MIRKVLAFSIILVLMFTSSISAASNEMGKGKNKGPSTIGEVEEILIDYMKENDITFNVGSYEYVNYLTEQLLYENDEELAQHLYSDEIRIYAATYLDKLEKEQFENSEIDSFVLDTETKEKTLQEIKKENIDKNNALNKEQKKKQDGESDFSAASHVYDGIAAAAYAREWGDGRNPEYNSHFKDCTNFVSQAAEAGGKPQHYSSPSTGITSTTNYWYSIKYQEWRTNYYVDAWKESSSFIGVNDFYKYWVYTKGLNANNYSYRYQVSSYAEVGDIIQLKDTSSGDWYHSIIVTKKVDGKLYYSGHTSNRVDHDFDTISSTENDFRVIKFVGTYN
ncbi:amidase domain-containing protein [Gracilibacillus sp. YIM 98692]|uniref:amidase domain-containing protein n=1 Tax=Gracilibacillus sp. YIM 98692 TaxID=2663532 RepID=UPI0013D0FC31|nr:amidase domain-containing protein [Gracilibacillus sp. YIM 98692]